MSAPYGNNQGENPYNQSGPGGYPPSGQQPHGGNPYGQNTGAGAGYPPSQTGGYPGQQPPYAQQGGYPGQQPPYPSQGGYPGQQTQNPSQGGYPGQQTQNPSQGGYPGQQTQNPSQGGYPGQQQPYPSQGGYPGQQAQNPSQGGYPGQQPQNPSQGGYPGQQPQNPSQGGYRETPIGGAPSGPGASVTPGGFAPNDPRIQRLAQVVQQYEINQQFAARLHALGNCEIVILCDDSGSMNTPLQGSNQTRWDELKSLVSIVTEICSVIDSDGVDVYFLNRNPVPNVTNAQSVRHVFNSPPQGLTPLVPAIRKILAAKRSQSYEKKLLILIATDGAPTNEYGQIDIAGLEGVLRNERNPQTYVTFLACTDDLQAVNYLSNWDKSLPNLDVVDDYRSELADIQKTRGANFPFSFGDYIVKALLGSIDPWFDSLDERA